MSRSSALSCKDSWTLTTPLSRLHRERLRAPTHSLALIRRLGVVWLQSICVAHKAGAVSSTGSLSVSLDDSIIKTAPGTSKSADSFQDKIKKMAPAYAGSCALLSLYDPITSPLHVACTGDSRAVLGQKGSDGKWAEIPLSVDQTGSNEEETTRISKDCICASFLSGNPEATSTDCHQMPERP
jgi:hypothetical protein